MVRFLRFALFAFGVFLLAIGPTNAQQTPDDLLLQFQKRLQGGDMNPSELSPYEQKSGEDDKRAQNSSQSSQKTENALIPASAIEISYRERLRALSLGSKTGKGSSKEDQATENQSRMAPLIETSGKWSQDLKQVGYDVLRSPSDSSNGPPLVGGISDTYILGLGDQVTVTLRGQANITNTVVIDRNGQVILPNLPPLNAAGRSFGDFRDDLQSQVATSMIETKAFVTLGAVRQLSVLVSGEVEQPGVVSVNGLSTVVDALIAAHGIRNTGTLRAVQVIRDGKRQTLDLYPLLLGLGQPGDLSLREGDRIVVPAIGPTIALFSGVSRPGIYELTENAISLPSALQMAGGTLISKGTKLIKISQGSDGRVTLNEYTPTSKGTLRRGDLLGALPVLGGTQGTIYLSGHVYDEGWRALSTLPSLRTLLSTHGTLREEPYLPFVVVKRPNPNTLMPEFIAVDGARLLKNGEDFAFQDQDRVTILSLSDIRYLSSEDIRLILRGQMPAYGRTEAFSHQEERQRRSNMQQQGLATASGAQNMQTAYQQKDNDVSLKSQAIASMKVCSGLRALARQVAQDGSDAEPALAGSAALQDAQVCPDLYDQDPDLLPFLVKNLLSLDGAVYRPGYYPAVEGGYLADIITAAGGPLNTADANKVEVTLDRNGSTLRQEISLALAQADYTIGPLAAVRISKRFSDMDGGVMVVRGEVRSPGRYRLLRGEHLSQLIERAGGYTDEAYVLGAVFLRDAVRNQEKATYQRIADEMEQGIPSALQKIAAMSNSEQATGAMTALQQAVQTLRAAQAAGRMVVDANPVSLQGNPEADILLHPGDVLYVPRRPSHLMVSGEVMHAGAQRFEAGLSAEEYIARAGGLRDSADESQIFVVLPNGVAKSLTLSSWNYQETQLPPGSTIVVPRDLNPMMFWSYARDTLSIFSDIAISAAALASIND
jgi:protein involved in polysaccharide export with SLBB domain